MLLSQQEMTMSKQETEYTAPEVLTDKELELVSGGEVDVDGNIPICPPWWPGRPGLPVPTSGSPLGNRK